MKASLGLFIAASITTAFATVFYGLLLARLAGRKNWRLLILGFLIALPLQPLTFYAVRMPLNVGLYELLGSGLALTIVSVLYAPLTEEPAKWLTLLVPAIRRGLTKENAVALALAVGLGFGVGEIWLLAANLMHAGDNAQIPFYKFGGFFVERTLVCFIHGAFIAYAFKRLAEGRSFLLGGLVGVALHFLLNAPVFLAAFDLFDIGRGAWQQVLMIWIAGFSIALVAFVVCLWRRS
jgi:RsiW-degrading membrane proteinase PrsW (M82 family)